MDDRAADRTAIDDVAKSFMQAFEKGNADGVVGHMTSGAELIAPDGTTIRGKDDLAKSFTEYFREHPRHAVVAERELLRFLGKDSALDEGIMKVDNGSGEVGLHRYVILYVREDGKWRIGVLRNDEIDKGSLMDLEWLIGSWKARRADVEVDTTYSWMGKKNFIKMDFTIKEKDKTHSGMQIIGLDPATGTLRTWTFEDSGAIGSGSCARDGSRWIFENQASLADGSVMTASNILTPINRDAFTWQPINLAVDDVPLANLPPVKVTRVKAEKPVK